MTVFNLPKAVYRDLRGIETEPRSDEEHLEAGIEWLYRSQDVTDCGGSAAYYSFLTGWSDPYPETSGYIIPTLYDYGTYGQMYKLGLASEARSRARRMAEWLLTTQLKSGAFPAGTDPTPESKPSVFNTGQILFGLTRAFRETGDEAFLNAIERAGKWLVDVQHEDGYWDRFDYRGEIHSYCSRVAWALLETYEITGDDRLQEAAVVHLEWVLSTQTDDDWFEYAAFSSDEVPYLHTIAYTVRGLLESGLRSGDDRFVSAARATADRLLKCHYQEGPLLGAYNASWEGKDFYCLTGNAQTVLIWIKLFELFEDEKYLDAIDTELGFLKAHQVLDGMASIKGGIKGSHPVWGSYMRLRYPNWSVKFFIDALVSRPDV